MRKRTRARALHGLPYLAPDPPRPRRHRQVRLPRVHPAQLTLDLEFALWSVRDTGADLTPPRWHPRRAHRQEPPRAL